MKTLFPLLIAGSVGAQSVNCRVVAVTTDYNGLAGTTFSITLENDPLDEFCNGEVLIIDKTAKSPHARMMYANASLAMAMGTKALVSSSGNMLTHLKAAAPE